MKPASTRAHRTIEPSSADQAPVMVNNSGVARAWLRATYDIAKLSVSSATSSAAMATTAPMATHSTAVRSWRYSSALGWRWLRRPRTAVATLPSRPSAAPAQPKPGTRAFTWYSPGCRLR